MKVTIIGKGKGCKDAPRSGLTWGITQQLRKDRTDRIIDMNDYSLWGETEAKIDKASRRIAEELGIPYVDLTNYPYREVTEFFKTDYFSNTVDFALALAIYEGFTEIDLYGITMEAGSEYYYQKPGVEYWVGRAQGLGVKVYIHGLCSTILRTKEGLVYGYGTPQMWRNEVQRIAEPFSEGEP
jgi:hypothetical protein